MEKTLFSKGSYVEGAFLKKPSQKAKKHILFSPADLKDKVFEFFSDPDHLDLACESSKKAYPIWSALSQDQRNHYLEKLAKIYQEKCEEIAILISRETGKPLWESRLEAKALAQKIDITLKKSLPLVRDTLLASLGPGTQGKVTYRSKGAFLVLGPFNFPAHLPNGHIIAALATGNTVVFKPSEKTPATGEKLAECFHQAGFPKGVFNLVQGGADIAQALVTHESFAGVLFTGSYAVGRKIQEALWDQPQKTLALEMGGKNSALVWKDADLENALYEVLKGAYITCGQRCSSTSRLILHKEIKEKFLKEFIRLSQKIKIGHWKDKSFMGPLIDAKAVLRFEKAYQEAKQEKAFLHLTGQKIKPLNGYYVSPTLVEPEKYNPSSFYQNEELFLPFLSVYCVSREEEALELINQSGLKPVKSSYREESVEENLASAENNHQNSYGLCLSLFSKEEPLMKKILQSARVGVFHWNLSTCSASSSLPFGGLGKSGNDHPAGLFAVYSCMTPVAFLKKDFLQETSSINPLKDFFK